MSNSGIATPGKIIAVHLNYPSRAAQRGRTPAQPSYFLKPSSSLAASGATLERPAGTELLAFEGEIALIIGEPARRVSPADGWRHVASVTAANDFGLYDLRAADKGSNVRSKGGDGFTPLGPDAHRRGIRRPCRPARAHVGQRRTRAGRHERHAALPVRPARRRPLAAHDPRDGRRHPHRHARRFLGRRARRRRRGRGRCTGCRGRAESSGRLVTTIAEGTAPFGDFGSQPAVDDHQRVEAWGDREAAGLDTTPPVPGATRSAGSEFELTDELRDLLGSVGVATLSVQLRKRGYVDVFLEGVHANRPGARVVGRARTLRFIPFRPDLFARRGGGYNAQKVAFDTVEPG